MKCIVSCSSTFFLGVCKILHASIKGKVAERVVLETGWSFLVLNWVVSYGVRNRVVFYSLKIEWSLIVLETGWSFVVLETWWSLVVLGTGWSLMSEKQGDLLWS